MKAVEEPLYDESRILFIFSPNLKQNSNLTLFGKKICKSRPFGPAPMHGGANLMHPAMHGSGVGAPHGAYLARQDDVDPAVGHGGVGGPRRGSWRGMPAPFKTSRVPTPAHFSPSLTARASLFLSLSHPSATLLQWPSPTSFTPIAPPRRSSPLWPVVPGPFPGHLSFEEGKFLIYFMFP